MKQAHAYTSTFWRYISIVLAFIVIMMPFHAFISTWLGDTIGPMWLWKSWKEIVLAVLCVAVLAWLIARHELLPLLKNKLILILCTYTLFAIFVSIGTGRKSEDALLAGLAMDLRYLMIFALAFVLVRFAPDIRALWLTRTPRLLVIAGLLLAAIGVIQVTLLPLDFLSAFGYEKGESIAPYVLIDDNPQAPRAFATLRGPNDYGAYLILPLVVALGYLVRVRDKVLLSLSIVAGLAVSASRSAWLGALAAVMAGIIAAKQLSRRRLILLGSIGAVILLATLVASLSIPAVRLAVFHSSPTDTSLTEGSTDAHWAATMSGIERVAERPLGCGAGCAGPASYYGENPQISENYFVQIAETYGIIGLVLWTALFVLVMRGLWKSEAKLSSALFASGVGLTVIGLWLHVWSDDPAALTWWCLAGIVLGANRAVKNRAKSVD